MISGIYCIQNKINGKVYIGQSNDIPKRWKYEKWGSVNRFLKEDFEVYGIDNFSFYVLEECSLENLNTREMFYIRLYHSYDRDFGYNVSLGGCYNKNRVRNEWERKMLRKATCKRYRESHKEQAAKYRKEHKEEISAYFKKLNEIRKESEAYKKTRKKSAENLRILRRKICIDPIIGDTITYSALQGRKNRNKEKYKDVVLRQCLMEVNNEKIFCYSGLSE